ncbi:glycosyltransferase family 2 protein [Pedobacter sp. MC2016-14]|uniref:glycosyltransferase family 2 protein n=1 Tax=Pedobacter sp. MC2016-14 TaxID=2897327 RepID=UPI001E2AF2AA|nr:glycosyltransferase family 2 protein [Pedobacter sp. MC2016-14]MCD0486953.1 glycosyltransferase family 2 protein [Pedobacter sp. MC2016-14]
MSPYIVALIVTNNRLALLKEAVFAVKIQQYPLLNIIVVNNGSTDGTEAWLNEQQGLLVIHQENSGGSGGFYTGIKKAAELNADWVWVMDDDTICFPDTLSNLVKKTSLPKKPVGFIGSKCIWTDRSPHLMNIPEIKPAFNTKIPFNFYDEQDILLVENSSFVSLLINIATIRAVGLPYREFFIWGDDQEYTRRITKAGFLGLYCKDSIALHKTPVNYAPDFYRDIPANLWKHKYGFRNEFFMVKKNRGFAYYFIWLLFKVSYTSFKLLSIRTQNRFQFISVLLGSAWASLFFNPKITRVL